MSMQMVTGYKMWHSIQSGLHKKSLFCFAILMPMQNFLIHLTAHTLLIVYTVLTMVIQ